MVNLNRYAECMGQAALAQAQQRGAARKLCETDRNDERQKLGNATRALQMTLQARAQQAHQKIVDQCVSSQAAAVRKAALVPTLNRYTLEYATRSSCIVGVGVGSSPCGVAGTALRTTTSQSTARSKPAKPCLPSACAIRSGAARGRATRSSARSGWSRSCGACPSWLRNRASLASPTLRPIF